MAKYTTNEFKNGLKLMIDNAPCTIVDANFVKPGKGQAFCKVKYRNLITGKSNERTFKSGESVEAADVMTIDMQYLYGDGETWHFMVPESFEQFEVDAAAMSQAKKWLKGQEECQVTLWNNVVIVVDAPNFVELAVTDTDPGVRGDTSGGGIKPATLETGSVVRVPLFINIDDVLKVDTRTGEYVSRAKS